MFLEIALILASVGFLLSTIFIDYLHDNLAFRIIEFYKLATFALLLTASRLSSGLLIRLLLALLHGMFPNCHHLLYVGYSIRNNLKRFLIAASLVAGYSVLFGEISLHIKALRFIEKIFVVSGVVSFIWLFKSIVVKSLAAWFYVKTYHVRASQCVYYRFLVESLSGLPLMEVTAAGVSQKRLRRLKKFNPKKLSAWHIKKMMLYKKEGLAIKFKTKSETKLEAEKMFNNVANPSFEFIDLKDLQRFFGEDESV